MLWSQVDFGAGTVRLEPHTTKNSEGRSWPAAAHPVLAGIIREQRRLADEAEREFDAPVANVFFKVDRNERRVVPLGDYAKAWRSVCKRAGVKNKRVHDTRRGAVRELERAGVSRSVAMSLTGHKTESVYRRYAVTDLQSQREGVEKLARLGQIPASTVTPLSLAIPKK
jgi:integrase